MSASTKPKVAFFDFAGCEGCQLTVIDALQIHPEILDVVEIVQFREAMDDRGDDYQIAFVEGSYTQESDVTRLQMIRAQADLVIALGACAHLGGVNALRNQKPFDAVRRYVYGEAGKRFSKGKALPIEAVIHVDGVIPGCPIDGQEFVRAVRALILGHMYTIPDTPVCYECKLQENACLMNQGVICLGAITRSGCRAICPAYGVGCLGCRGLTSEPNIDWLGAAMAERGIAPDMFQAALDTFLSHQFSKSEVDRHA
jgi:sulfhydrogenase subunit delta